MHGTHEHFGLALVVALDEVEKDFANQIAERIPERHHGSRPVAHRPSGPAAAGRGERPEKSSEKLATRPQHAMIRLA